MPKLMFLPLVALLACGGFGPAEPDPSFAEVTTASVTVTADIGSDVCKDSPPILPGEDELGVFEPEGHEKYENVSPSYTQWCAWNAESTDGKPAHYYIRTGIEAPDNEGQVRVVHTIHWYIHGDLSPDPRRRKVNHACWENPAPDPTAGPPWPPAWDWEESRFCTIELSGDVTLEASVGWPPCPEVTAAHSLREIKPGRRGTRVGLKADARIC